MNKSRRMAALQSRILAQAGCSVLQIDLYGCGDSDGDFGDARWDIWKRDIESARAWLEREQGVPVSLWGLRLGASLAAEFAAESGHVLGPLLLWQPVLNGETFLTQFLRQRIANEMLKGAERNGTQALRARMAAGEPIEVSGYMLPPALAAAIDGVKLAASGREGVQVDWFEVLGELAEDVTPATRRVRDELSRRGMDVRLHTIRGEPFWATVEIAECPRLLEATVGAVTRCQ